MNRITANILGLSTALAAIAFMSDQSAGVAAPPAAAAPAAAKKKPAERVAPEIAGIDKGIPLPAAAKSNRGSKSAYEFDALEVGDSIAILNKTAKQISSIVSNQNRKDSNQRPALNADGSQKMKIEQREIKDAAGNVVGKQPVNVPETEWIKEFRVVDVDPKKDPKKAKCRIWRVK